MWPRAFFLSVFHTYRKSVLENLFSCFKSKDVTYESHVTSGRDFARVTAYVLLTIQS